jgi:hypothetical protein
MPKRIFRPWREEVTENYKIMGGFIIFILYLILLGWENQEGYGQGI